VRTAYIEVLRTREQVAAKTETRRLREESLRSEMEKFRVGKSTSIIVGGAQRDLLRSRLTEAQARADYLKALTELYRVEGTLLPRRGLEAPGAEAVRVAD